MKQECNKIQSIILSTDEYYPESVNVHCKSCSDCAEVASHWQNWREVKTVYTPKPTLDYSIINASHDIYKKRKQRITLFRRLLYYSAASASIAAAYSVTMYPIQTEKAGVPAIVKSWDWSKFESATIETSAAAEVSHNYIYNVPEKRFSDAAIVVNSEISTPEV